MARHYWSEEDIHRFEALRKAGKSFTKIAEIMGLSYASVRGRSRVDPDKESWVNYKLWSDEDDETLLKCIAEKMTYEQIGERLNRQKRSVESRAVRLGVALPHPTIWSDEAKATLIEMFNRGVTYEEIGKVVGRSRKAVGGQLHRMGLTTPITRKFSNPKTKFESPVEYVQPDNARVVLVKLDSAKIPRIDGYQVKGSEPKPLTSRKFGECSFPVEGDGYDTLYCCLPVRATKNYCKAHYRVMYVMK